MIEDIIFLTLTEVMAIHQNQIDNYGGSLGIKDQRMLDAALSQPKSGVIGRYLHPDIYSMAGAYLYHLAMDHPFIDGNKRVATVSALIFLELNNYELDVNEDLLKETVFKVAAGQLSKNELIEFIRIHTKAILNSSKFPKEFSIVLSSMGL